MVSVSVCFAASACARPGTGGPCMHCNAEAIPCTSHHLFSCARADEIDLPAPTPDLSPLLSHVLTLRSHPHTQTRPLITRTRMHVHAGTHSRPRMAQHARANTCTQTCMRTFHGAPHGAAVGPVPAALGRFLGYLCRRRRRSVGLAHWARTGGVRTRSAGAGTVLVALAVVRRLGVPCRRSGHDAAR